MMTLARSLFAQLRSSWSAILLVLAVSAALLGGVLLWASWWEIPVGDLTRDPANILGCSPHIGFLSQLGIFFWSASATICLFSAYVLSRGSDTSGLKSFLWASGLLSLLVGLDDAFLVHESVLPSSLGISEEVVYATYAGLILLFLVRFLPTIFKTEWILLGMALAFFGASILWDVERPASKSLFEDGTKYVGMVAWLVYYSRLGASTICQHRAQQSPPPEQSSAAKNPRE